MGVRGSRRVGGIGLAAVLLLAAASCAKAPPTGISDVSETFAPRGVPWNGVRVYLSAPRHASSGSRGECGWEENINGRTFALYAADTNTIAGESTLTERGYEVRVSANTKDNGYLANRDESDNWGATVHIPTHSNAYQACGSTPQYLLVMNKTTNGNSTALRDRLLQQLDPHVPGGINNSINCDGLAECGALAPHVAYVELFFHTNQAAVDWFQGPVDDPNATGAWNASPALGAAVDDHLGHPRSTGEPTALDDHPGFGTTADSMLRDETIAYWEAFRRQQLVAECMGEAGFTYSPAVAFPAQDAAAIAESLGVDAARSGASPSERNRRYEAGLSATVLERYSQTLWGESAADMATVNSTELVPAGRSAQDFATGGCVGAARAAVPSVWDAPRALASAGPAAAAADQSGVLEAQARRYSGVMRTIADDDALADYLATGGA